jgi:hypothetical protein
MTANFSTYVTYSADTSYHLYSTVLVDGSAIIHPSEYCNLSGVTHFGTATNVLNGTGGSVYGPRLSPSSYISVSNPQDIIGSPGVEYPESADGEITCSAIGTFYSSSPGGNVEIAVSSFVFDYNLNGQCKYNATCSGTCTEDGRVTPASTWLNNICPAYLFCVDAVELGVCLGGLCAAKTVDPHLCT